MKLDRQYWLDRAREVSERPIPGRAYVPPPSAVRSRTSGYGGGDQPGIRGSRELQNEMRWARGQVDLAIWEQNRRVYQGAGKRYR
jgi:hypothetical protein